MSKKEFIVTPKKIALDLAACKTAFDAVGIPWVIMGGIVLGYARYNAIMEWDTDLDIGVFVEMTNKQWAILVKTLRGNGFRISNERIDFKVGSREVPFNLWVFHKNGKHYESFPNTTQGFKFVEKAKWYDRPKMVNFLEDKYPMPNYMEDYLVCQYGKDWKTNIVKDHEAYYLDKRGSRDTSKWLISRASKYGDLWPKTLKIEDSMGNNNAV